MALITHFERTSLKLPRTHRTTVTCFWSVIGESHATLLQLDTRGSETREHPGKLSQTLQLDRDRAQALVAILTREFNL
jgi:hypothetical protein